MFDVLLPLLLLLVTAGGAFAAARYVWQSSPNPSPPYTNLATAAHVIQDAVDVAVAGDEVVVRDGVYATGGRAVYGLMTNRVAVDRPITLRSVNGPQFTVIQGYQVPGITNGDGAIRCVSLADGASLSGFTLTQGATRTFTWDHEDEISGGAVWCESQNSVITNCVITGNAAGSHGGGVCRGTVLNCTLSGNTVTTPYVAYGGGASQSILRDCMLVGNTSVLDAGGAESSTLINCALIANSAAENGGAAVSCALTNCTLSGNAGYFGGGACYGTLTNCKLVGNTAPEGGGAFMASLTNCVLINNSTGQGSGYGGGARYSTLVNCSLTGNSAAYAGGGAWESTLYNCIVYSNTAPGGANYDRGTNYDHSTLNYCCTTPMPLDGTGNITNGPLFVDYAGGNLRLQSNSPCINAGRNAYAPGPTDLDGLPRIVSGTVDIGAYEFQGPGSVISYAWLQHYGLPTDGSADATDPDGDGHTTLPEWRCLTDPTNALSALRLLSASPAGTNVTVSWQSVAGVSAFLERSTNLSPPSFFTPLATGIPGQPGETTYTNINAAAAPRLFYRVGVGN